jgi:hypothetical protein
LNAGPTEVDRGDGMRQTVDFDNHNSNPDLRGDYNPIVDGGEESELHVLDFSKEKD